MCRAFSVLQETRGDGGEPVVTQAKWNHLVKLVKLNISNAHRELLWSVLDNQNKGHIGKLAFVHLTDLLSIQVISVRSQKHPVQVCFPSLYDSSASRIIRHMVHHRFRAIINTLIKTGPTILIFGQLIVVVYYIFAMVAMELFKGKVQFFEPNSTSPDREYCANPLLKGTTFAKLNYCKNNFNNVISSYIVLLELTMVNQWHVMTSGFTAVTHISARMFFILFHIVVVIIIINIFVAFILEAFLVEYTVDKSDLQTYLEKKIEELELNVQQDVVDGGVVDAMESSDNDLGDSEYGKRKPSLMFKIASRRSRTVDGLLQQMFEANLRPEDFNEDVEPENINFSDPVFDSI